MTRGILIYFIAFASIDLQAQQITPQKDTLQHIQQVIIKAKENPQMSTQMKMAVSIDEFLSSSQHMSFIKRGAYAWEPLLNNMSSERSSITLDGMHIFGACTDKMDPVTSYLETNNLSSIDISSGQSGSLHGSTIAGSIDLKRKTTAFGYHKKWSGSYQSGFEGNNKQLFNLGNLSYATERFVADGSVSYRHAGNYKDGENQQVLHSQFSKFNSSVALAYKTSELSSLRVDAVFDQANDVGYPALPMDLWLSRALITSATYKKIFEAKALKSWENKIYFNAIEHYMDDSKRAENLVHMDMPGWSTTYGLNSVMSFASQTLQSQIQLNAYDNVSIAEMTMYPQDRSKTTMFAYSWPWVKTRFVGLSAANTLALSTCSSLNFGGALGWNYNRAKYVEFNRIFHPDAAQEKNRMIPSVYASYQFHVNQFDFSLGTGYGQRAPSVSEGYGYYIYNSFDRYDYIGNPDLKNEVSYELNASAGYVSPKLTLQAKANYFKINNYIIGKILSLGSPMNYQSVGTKGYSSLEFAQIFNMSLLARYDILDHLHWMGTINYARAKGDRQENLPFIRPLSYQTSLHFMYGNFAFQGSVNGDFSQQNYSPEYGEDLTPSYLIANISADYTFKFSQKLLRFQLGAENLFNTYYSTYADWGNIPRMGRNVYTSLKFNF